MRDFHFDPKLEPPAIRDWLYACYELHVDSLTVQYEAAGHTAHLYLKKHNHTGYVKSVITYDMFHDCAAEVIVTILNEMLRKAETLPSRAKSADPTVYED